MDIIPICYTIVFEKQELDDLKYLIARGITSLEEQYERALDPVAKDEQNNRIVRCVRLQESLSKFI